MSTELILKEDAERLVELILAAAEPYEFNTFVIGIERPRDYSREEHDAVFRCIKIEIGTRLSDLWPGRDVDFERPEVRFDIRARSEIRIVPRSAPLFVGGRYRKLSREIPAARWKHNRCRGRGCRGCNYTGNVHGPSVQELATPAVLEATGGEEMFLHGAGREDVDARMLGEGRPFVFEVRQPRRRFLDLEALAARINEAAVDRASVRCLLPATREEMIAAKASGAEKTYGAHVQFDGAVPHDIEARIASLAGAEIEQLSPVRVMHRRGEDTLRRRRVSEARLIRRDEGEVFLLEIRAAAGTYIKELIHGDGGRTRPSVASLSGIPCRCVALDVLAIHWTPPWEERAGVRIET